MLLNSLKEDGLHVDEGSQSCSMNEVEDVAKQCVGLCQDMEWNRADVGPVSMSVFVWSKSSRVTWNELLVQEKEKQAGKTGSERRDN